LDPGGGAGLIADVKAIESHGCWAAAVATALTSQTVAAVRAVEPVSGALLADQVAAVFEDFEVSAVKVGMLAGRENVLAVAAALGGRDVPIVLDPVCGSTSGTRFLDEPALEALRVTLLPLVHVLTPNQEEAGILSGIPGAAADEAAASLRTHGVEHVLVSGGEGLHGHCVDRLFSSEPVREIVHRSLETNRVHGTGCLHSASIAARLAQGDTVYAAACAAAAWMEQAIQHGVPFGGGGSPDAAWWAQ
jgi:hydroxymethylpyrimidine/phosphomethylpyrimidine kinase